MAQRFELELITIFKSQGLDAAVNKMQQQLRSVSAPAVPGGAGANPAAQIAQYNAARVQFERLIQEGRASGQISSGAATAARAQVTNQINKLLQTNQEFVQAVTAAERQGIALLRNTAQVRAAASPVAPVGRSTTGATVSGGPVVSPRVQRTLDQAESLETDRTEGELAQATALLARERRQLAAQTNEIIAVDETYMQASIRLAATRAQLAASEAKGVRGDPAAFQAQVEKDYQSQLTNKARRTEVDRRILRNEEDLLLVSEQRLLAEQRTLAEKQTANRIAVEQNRGAQVLGGGTTFQRAQAAIAARQSGGVVDPSRFQTGGQFVASRAFTTAGFAVSGAALYGGVNALQSMVSETEKLDVQFKLLQQQMDATGQGADFKEFRSSMLGISRETGIAASDVTNIGFQLRGAFDDTTEAIENTSAAMKLVRISGLGIDEVTNDMTATAVTYGVTFEQIGDAVVSIERRYGVLASQSLNTFGQMSNTAHQAGLSFEELSEIIGAVSRVSGRSSGAIAESFNRILPSIQSNAAQIQEIYSTALDAGQIDKSSLDQITEALSKGQSGKALIDILRDYEKFNQAQQNQLQFVLGGARESQTIAPLVQQRAQILEGAQRGPEADRGALDTRFEASITALDAIADKIGRRFQQLGVALGEAGLLDALKLLGGGLLLVLDATTQVLEVFNQADDLFGGIPSKIVAIVVAIKLLQIAITGLRQFGSAAGGIFGGRKGLDAARDVVGDAAVQAQGVQQRQRIAPFVAGPRTVLAGQGTLFDEAVVQRSMRQRLTQTLSSAVAGVRQAPGRATDAYRATGQIARQPALPGLSPLAQTATLINTQVQTAGRGFASSVGAGLRTMGQRIQAQLVALGNLNARTYLPGGGGAAGQAGGRASTFITGGGGLQGGIATAFAGLAAFSSLAELKNTYQQQQQQLGQQQVGIKQQLGTKSLDELLRLQQEGTFKDNWATRAGSNIGLNASVGETGSQAIGRATEREFEQAINAGILARNAERDRLLEQVKKSQGMGKAGDEARKQLAGIGLDDRKKLAEYSQTVGKAKEEAETSGQSNVDEIASIQQQYELGSLSYTEYVDKLRANVERLRELAPSGKEAKDNYQRELQKFIGVMNTLSREQDQLFQQGLEAQGLTPLQRADALSKRLSEVQSQPEFQSLPPGASGPPSLAPKQETLESKKQELNDLNNLLQAKRQLFEEAIQNVSDPALLEQLRQAFSLTPEQLARFQELQKELGKAIGDTGELTIQAKQLEATRDRELQLAQSRAQVAIAGMSDPAAIARIQQDLANKQLENAKQITSDPGLRDQAIAQAELSQAQAARQARDTADSVAQARLQAQAAASSRDPVAAAQNQAAQARLAMSQARGDAAAMYQAQAQLTQAQQQMQEAQQQIGQARINVFKAQHPEDVIAQAQAAQREADLAAANAHGTAARLDAMAQRIAADKQMQEALRAVADSQSDLLKAQFTASGELLLAAQEGLQQAERALADARKRGAGEEVINPLRAEVLNQKEAVRHQQIADAEELIQFDLEMGNITKEVAIARYRALAILMNPREQRALMLKIHQLEKDAQGAADGLQFNLPTTLGLPTLYTARRLMQETGQDGRVYAGGPGGGVTNYDNRVITVELNANGEFDGQQAVQTIVNALNEAPRYGTQPRIY